MAKTIQPGIYRTLAGFPFGPPGLEKHLRWCAENGREPNLESITKALDDALSLHEDFLRRKWPRPCYFDSPLTLLDAWKRGYERKRGILNPIYPYAKGFELQYVTWDEKDPYHRIDDWQGLGGDGRLEGIVIATDLNGILDISGWMALAVNDFDNKRILTYKPKEEVSDRNQATWRKNTFITNEDPYVTDRKREFPFSSLNPLKTANHTWITIGYSPHDIYNALKQIGFKFPD